jgi:hypothetical protein
MTPRVSSTAVILFALLAITPFRAQDLHSDQRDRVDGAIPRKAQVTPRRPRRLLVTSLTMRDGKPVRSTSSAAIPVCSASTSGLLKPDF